MQTQKISQRIKTYLEKKDMEIEDLARQDRPGPGISQIDPGRKCLPVPGPVA